MLHASGPGRKRHGWFSEPAAPARARSEKAARSVGDPQPRPELLALLEKGQDVIDPHDEAIAVDVVLGVPGREVCLDQRCVGVVYLPVAVDVAEEPVEVYRGDSGFSCRTVF
jgi:hypothetical protein